MLGSMDSVIEARKVLAKTYPTERELRDMVRLLMCEVEELRVTVRVARQELGVTRALLRDAFEDAPE